MRIRSRAFVTALVATEIAVGFWIFFAPTKVGGSSTYAVTAGVSMQPLLYKNDLAIVRTESAYHVGDVVLYNSAVLGKPVLHRIILIQNGQYYFKGDNNNFVDPGYATRAELVGKLWVHVPDLGAAVDWFGQPFHAALLAGVASMFVVLAGGKPRRRRRRRRHHGFAALPPSSSTRTEEQPWPRKEEGLDTSTITAEIGVGAHR